MITPQDPNAVHAWMLAIPSAITAVSTWYLNRKTVKTSKEAHTKTAELMTMNTSDINSQISDMEARLAALEKQVEKTRDCTVILAQKYVDTVNGLDGLLKEGLKRSRANRSNSAQPAGNGLQESSGSADENGKVTVVDAPAQPIGKVIRKP